MLAFNSTKNIRSIYSCIFYFMDNNIAGLEESLGLIFFLFHIQQHFAGAPKTFSKPIYTNLCLYLVRRDEGNSSRVEYRCCFFRSKHDVKKNTPLDCWKGMRMSLCEQIDKQNYYILLFHPFHCLVWKI